MIMHWLHIDSMRNAVPVQGMLQGEGRAQLQPQRVLRAAGSRRQIRRGHHRVQPARNVLLHNISR